MPTWSDPFRATRHIHSAHILLTIGRQISFGLALSLRAELVGLPRRHTHRSDYWRVMGRRQRRPELGCYGQELRGIPPLALQNAISKVLIELDAY